jgi:ubiquinone biosynthesis protein Coq4
MPHFSPSLKIKQAITQLFAEYNIPAEAYTSKYFIIRVGKLPIYVPNTAARVKIARFHDIHHILTGYAANWKGEAEIGAWELATGCRTSFIAWFLNSGAVLVGLVMHPIAVIKAFRRGFKTKTNLYHDFDYDALMDMTIGELQNKIGLAEV